MFSIVPCFKAKVPEKTKRIAACPEIIRSMIMKQKQPFTNALQKGVPLKISQNL